VKGITIFIGNFLKSPKMGSTKSKVSKEPVKRVRSKLNLPAVDLKKFLDFCESKKAGENVRFYMAVQEYEKLFQDPDADVKKITAAGEAIVVKYLSEKSPTEISLDHKNKQKIMKVYDLSAWTNDTFRAARIEVVCTLTDHMVPAYEKEFGQKRG